MRSSRGMGAVRTSKMPKGLTISRKDNPDKVKMFAKGGKVKKAEGGDVDFENTPASISSDITAPSYSFGEEFSAARKAGMKTFEYKGKKYTTEVAKPTAKPAARPTAAAPKPAAKPAARPTAAASKPTGQTPYQMSQQMKKDAAGPSRPAFANPKLQTELIDAQKRSKARQDALDSGGYDAAAKGRGKAISEFFSAPKPAAAAVSKPAPKPDNIISRNFAGQAAANKTRYDKNKAQQAENKRVLEARAKARGMAKGGSANFIKGAIKKPGALRASLGAKPGKPIPAGKLDKASKAPGKLGQRARFAEMLRGFRKNKE